MVAILVRLDDSYGIQEYGSSIDMFPIWYTKYVSLLDFKNYGFNKGTMMRKRLLDPSGAPSITSGLTQEFVLSGHLF